MKTIFLPILLAGVATAAPAWAHAKLQSSDPAANSSVKSPSLIRLVFSESLEPAFSGATLSDADGKKIPVSASVGGSTITLMPLSLKPGAYKVNWHSVGHDTHRISGTFSFKVVP
ncbi:MAG TPA: copper homeostasis periplasmic binding protein CopC [Rhizomicrobium sp.]|nr:copper homeostasis periplasmic binding protein CopC [Rhizomicrobium sp.]